MEDLVCKCTSCNITLGQCGCVHGDAYFTSFQNNPPNRGFSRKKACMQFFNMPVEIVKCWSAQTLQKPNTTHQAQLLLLAVFNSPPAFYCLDRLMQRFPTLDGSICPCYGQLESSLLDGSKRSDLASILVWFRCLHWSLALF